VKKERKVPFPIDLAFTIDPVPRPDPTADFKAVVKATYYARRWINYYQQVDTLSLGTGVWGKEIPGAENTKLGKAEFGMKQFVDPEQLLAKVPKEVLSTGDWRKGHVDIAYYKPMLMDLQKAIEAVGKEK